MNTILEQIETSEPEQDKNLQRIDNAIAALKGGDDGAHWAPEVIAAFQQLYQDDRACFQRKRAELKKASNNAQISEWFKEFKPSGDDTEDSSKASELVNMVNEYTELFHDEKNNGYATFTHNNHQETWPLESSGFSDWMSYQAYTELGFTPSDTVIKQTLTTLHGIAKYSGIERKVYLRCAPCDDGYLIDLTNDQWQAVKITPVGWQVIDDPDVRFIRSNTAQALPQPTQGHLELLWQHVNIPEALQPLALAFLLESWRPDTAFTILIITGEQGSAKSSTHTRLRQLSDPNTVPLRAAPKTVEDIYVSATNNWQASFENMSKLSSDKQDALCTLATGGGFAARKLYTNTDESVMEVKRPVIINGIDNVATRSDLIDRTVALHLPKIDDLDKKSDLALDAAFARDLPAIFAGLLDLFSATLRHLPSVHIERPPRMVDFAHLGEAMLLAMGMNASFNELYKSNRRDSLAHSLDSSPAALAVMEMSKQRNEPWEGTLKQLKNLLDEHYHQEGEGWPKSPRGLGEILRRMAPALRETGVEIVFEGRKNDGIHVRITFVQENFNVQNNVHNVHSYTQLPENGQTSGPFTPESEQVNVVNVDPENKFSAEKYIPTRNGKFTEEF